MQTQTQQPGAPATGAQSRLREVHSEVRVWVSPIDPDAVYRTPCAVHDNYKGFALRTGGDGGADNAPLVEAAQTWGAALAGVAAQALGTTFVAPPPAPLGFDSLVWNGEQYLKAIHGPLEWLSFAPDFTVRRGVDSATDNTLKSAALAGWTLRPLVSRLHSTVADPSPPPGAPPYDLRPALPPGEAVLEWQSQQGDKWERVIPIATPLWAGLRHCTAPANTSVKVKTAHAWPENAGASLTLDLNGVAFEHQGEPAVRFQWGNSWSLVFRGIGKTARVQLERKGSDDNGAVLWHCARRFEGGPVLDEKWWKSRHTVTVYGLAGLLLVSFDGNEFWFGEAKPEAPGGAPGASRPGASGFRAIRWSAAPLRVSVWGAECIIQLASVSFDREAGFKREVPVAAPPLSEVSWTCQGGALASVAVPGQDALPVTGIAFVDAVIGDLLGKGKAQVAGRNLNASTLEGRWYEVAPGEGRVDYTLSMRGTRARAPFVVAFAAQFPPTATGAPPEPVNLRMALTSIEVSSGDPESLPSAMAKIEVSVPMLKRCSPDWKKVVVPFRPVRIECDPKNDGNWQNIFFGYLLPEGVSSDGYNAERLSLTAIDPKIRLRAPAALVDGRFGPLDLDYQGTELYGGQAFQKLIGYELGRDFAGAVNGDGNWRRYLPRLHYPLLNQTGAGSYFASGAPGDTAGKGFLLPPPFGEDVESWIKKIAGFDYAVWFYDPALGERGAWVYGHAERIYRERGQTVHALHETTQGANVATDDTLTAWPLLSGYSGQGLLEKAYTRVQVWGLAPSGDALFPALYSGAATTPLPATDPLSEQASWPRTLLSKQEFINGRVGSDYAQSLARAIWREFAGRAPKRFDFTLKDQILLARWGEKVDWNGEELRVLSSKLNWQFGEGGGRSTTITARSLSGTGL